VSVYSADILVYRAVRTGRALLLGEKDGREATPSVPAGPSNLLREVDGAARLADVEDGPHRGVVDPGAEGARGREHDRPRSLPLAP
ncbi:hypothetical protein EJ08DRAFT_703986, partial [Tothia fuscella]